MINVIKSVIVIFLVSATSLMAEDKFPATVAMVKPSVVGIGIVRPAKSLNPSGPQQQYRGTGFVVGDGRTIVTNYHVLPDSLEEETSASLAVFVGIGKVVKAHKADIIATSAEYDLAVLKIGGASLPALTIDSKREVREGERVAFTGFPIGMILGQYPVTHTGIISAISPIVIPAVSSRTLTAAQIKRMKDPYLVYQLDATAYPGNSGSPLYDPQSGTVIGIVNSVLVKKTKEAVLREPSAISYAIPAKYIQRLLDE